MGTPSPKAREEKQMKRRIFTVALCLVASSCLLLVAPIRRAIAQTAANAVADDRSEPPTTQLIQDARSAGCTSGSSGNCTITLKWPTAFPNTAYTVTCVPLELGIPYETYTVTKGTASVSILFQTITGGVSTPEIDCIAVSP